MEDSKPRIGILTDTGPLNLLIESGIDGERFESMIFQSDMEDLENRIAEAELACLFLKTELKQANGLEICARFKGDKDLKKIHIVFISTSDDVAGQAIQYRADHFLKVPFKQADIVDLLNKQIKEEKAILYVDDSDIFHKAVVPDLKAAGYRVLEAWDGKQAWDIAREQRVHLIISDVEMPEMDGFTFCGHIKSDAGLNHIPVIITTTLDSEESIEKGFASGANDYLTKPFVMPELLNRVEGHLKKSGGRRRERIMVVDDNPRSRNIITQALRFNGFDPIEARNGRIALSKLRAGTGDESFHLVVTNYQMPVLDGHRLALEIRGDEHLAALPIIMINGRENRADVVRLQSAGIQAFIVKPFNADRLTAEVERVLAQDRLKRERRMMKHYLTDEAIDAVARAADTGEDEIMVENRFRTILFTDIAGFTPLCENLSPHEVVALLNTYFDVMVKILISYGADIDKFIGDAIMALFDGQEDGAHRAVCAGVEMIGALGGVRKETGIDIHMRVGINSGHLIMGDIGSLHYRRDFTVIGDNVNTAQRLESNAGVDGVLISRTTYDLLEGKVQAEKRKLMLKGKKDTFEGYQVKKVRRYVKPE